MTEYDNQKIEIPLRPGYRVLVYDNVDIDSQEGMVADIVYSGHVQRYVPRSGLLEMDDGTSLHELLELIRNNDGVEILNP